VRVNLRAPFGRQVLSEEALDDFVSRAIQDPRIIVLLAGGGKRYPADGPMMARPAAVSIGLDGVFAGP